MSSYVDSCNLRQTSETTSNRMFSFDLSGRASSHLEDVNVNGIFTCPVPTTSVEREEMQTSLRGIGDPALPRGPQIAMVSSSSSADANCCGGGGGGGGAAQLGRMADRDPQRSAKSGGGVGGCVSQEGERNAEKTQAAKRNTNASQRQDSDQPPQIYPWMTKLHMSHGKVCLFCLERATLALFSDSTNTSFRPFHFPS